MNVRTTVSMVGEAPVLAAEGVIDLSTIGQFHMDLTAAVRRFPGAQILVDLDAVTALDDIGLGVLLGAAAAARDAGGDLAVVATSERLRARLSRARFDRAVDVRASIS